jgi:hypothetical protein
MTLVIVVMTAIQLLLASLTDRAADGGPFRSVRRAHQCIRPML